MIIIAGYTRTDADKRDSTVEAFRGMVGRARAYDGCIDFSISADAGDPERVNIFECWRDQATLDAWRKIAKGQRYKPRKVAVNLYRAAKAENGHPPAFPAISPTGLRR
ncbi:antibiotic biosynthesis monooxygenase (plasmid) [Paracoccus methylovorus]|uniref:Antibiotic biosynthesis monooxygenase n=1 Tax=Paracoccus methylovorus TaxID=2812658 RepID=A0ABX7JJM2_9RHOB|nr:MULTISPECIES: antibiotic biosynthesis monooxygenase family protein [Paracoccus]QRZ14423.1 antibiotic biosynthesis monooxygenase [Paracoccus methylovorus]